MFICTKDLYALTQHRMVVGQQNANGIKSGLHDRSSSFSKITRHCFEQEMIGKQSRRGHANQLLCPLQAPSPLPIFPPVVPRAPPFPLSPSGLFPPLHSPQREPCLFPRLGLSFQTDFSALLPLLRI